MSANPLEKEIERKLKILVEGKLGGLCLKWVCPGWSGVPDRILLLPGGRIYFVELKRPKGGRVDPLQAWWKRRLENLGFTVWHVYNTEQLGYLGLILTDELERRRGE
jgi:hypothetical protein